MCNTEAAAPQQQRIRDNDRAKAVVGGLSATAPSADGYVGVDPGCRLKKASELWYIHGKRFDLSGFLKHHPGGSSILEAVRGAEDVTALFESYHALANTEDIRQRLWKFEWTGKVLDDVSEREAVLVGGKRKQLIRYRWDKEGFYAVLKARVKRYFLEKHGQRGMDPEKVSVNRFVKAPLSWYLKEVFIVAIYVPMFVYMLGYDMLRLGGASVSGWARAAFAVLAGAVLQAFSFCTLHDASHYGLWFKRPRAQEVLSRVCNAWTLWHHGLWVMHHVYGHHSFTGDPERDPDLVHARPYLRKSVLTPKEQYDPVLVRWQRFLAPLFMMVLPGATLGQTQAYVRAAHVGHLWHVSITEASVGTRWYEYVTYFLALGSHILAGNFWVSFCYFMGISVAYHLCVAPDHDTFESSIVNSIEAKRKNNVSNNNSNNNNSSSNNSNNNSNSSSSNDRLDARESNQSIECGSSRGRRSPSLLEGEERAALNGKVSIEREGMSVMGYGSCHSEPPQKAMEREKGEEEKDDWGEVQVRHSGNFSNGNFFVTQAMGGINYQIEHHLFPSVSHMLYDEIAPIVRETCREFCIPYNSHPTLWSAYKSYLKHLMVCSDLTDRTPQESDIPTQ